MSMSILRTSFTFSISLYLLAITCNRAQRQCGHAVNMGVPKDCFAHAQHDGDSAVLLQIRSSSPDDAHSRLVQTRHDEVAVVGSSATADGAGGGKDVVGLVDAAVKSRRHRMTSGRKFDVVSLSKHLQTIVQKVWGGMDLTPAEHDTLLQALEASGSRREHMKGAAFDSNQSKIIHLLGPPDSGTNLLVQSLHLNWPAEATEACRSSVMCDMSVWKHSISDENDIFERLQGCGSNICNEKLQMNMSNAVVILMVRSPISQMASWKNTPYSLEPCFNRPWGDMYKPCWSNTSPSCNDLIDGCGTHQQSSKSLEFSSSVNVYNRYIEEYLALRQDNRIGNVILLTYEDLVLTPDLELSRIAAAMGWSIPERFRILAVEAKDDNSRDRSEALDRLNSRKWLDEVGQENLKSICGLLNVEAIDGLSEGSHTSHPLAYSNDCANKLF